jgi:type IV secretory pathway VirB2 component (pilin)
VTALAIVNFVLGGLHFCCGLIVAVAFTAFAGVLGYAAQNSEKAQDPEAAKAVSTFVGMLAGFGAVIGIIIVIVALLYIAAGYGLLKRRQWGRVLTLILGVLSALGGLSGLTQIRSDAGSALGSAAIGIAYCVFAFVILLKKETAEEFS